MAGTGFEPVTLRL